MTVEMTEIRASELLRFTRGHNLHVQAFAKATGERFNLLRIMRIGHLEVKTHSPILAELLDPQGSHDQGAVFLQLFVELLEISGFNSAKAKVSLEYYAGPLTDKSGGRIDILVKDFQGGVILIENKIFADDQENQMLRYRDFDEDATLFYLTLDGRSPSNLTESQVANIRCISYSSDVLSWLRECRREAVSLPIVRESITQYIHLVEYLTQQTTTISMNQNLITEITGSKETLNAFFTLAEARTSIEETLITQLDRDIDRIAKQLNLQRVVSLKDLRKKEAGFTFTTQALKKNNLQICFEFALSGLRDFYFGFALLTDTDPCPIAAKITAGFKKKFGGKSDTYYLGWVYWDEYRQWGQKEFEAIRNGTLADDIEAKIKNLLKIVDSVI